jgi:glycine C-acetyltransferase
MYTSNLLEKINNDLLSLKAAGKFKVERLLQGPQGPVVKLGGRDILLFASNNYLGLANHPEVVEAATKALKKYGYGLSSVRFICGTQEIHQELEQKLAKWLGVEDVILYSTCFMANLGFFATLCNEKLGSEKHVDAIYSDALNHASIIDALKLAKKELVDKKTYAHANISELTKLLDGDKNKDLRHRFIVTDGVFSMEGDLAPLPELIKVASEYQALLFVDDSHGVGVLGKIGSGTPEELGVRGQVDVLAGTLGKALGGAVGGYIGGKQTVIDLLRQKSRTYVFSNSLPPHVVSATIKVLDLLEQDKTLLRRVRQNSDYFREKIIELGFKTLPGNHPIIPIMIGDAKLTQIMSQKLLEEGLYVVGLWFPVVPEGKARLRIQISAAHSQEQLDKALAILKKVGKELKLI